MASESRISGPNLDRLSFELPDQPPKSLWDVMNRKEPAEWPQPRSDSEAESATSSLETRSGETANEPLSDEPLREETPKSLWGVMGVGPPEPAGPSEIPSEISPNEPPVRSPAEAVEDAVSGPADGIPQAEVPFSPRWRARSRGVQRASKGLLSFALGTTAVPLSALAMRPEVWSKLPAAVVGFLAVIWGWLALSDARRFHGRRNKTAFAWLGIVLGLVGMFLGPLVFAR